MTGTPGHEVGKDEKTRGRAHSCVAIFSFPVFFERMQHRHGAGILFSSRREEPFRVGIFKVGGQPSNNSRSFFKQRLGITNPPPLPHTLPLINILYVLHNQPAGCPLTSHPTDWVPIHFTPNRLDGCEPNQSGS